MTFAEAWHIVKHKGPVNLPSVQQKVTAALRVVEPHLLAFEQRVLSHARGPACRSHKDRREHDFICKVIEDRIYRGIEFKGPL